MEPTPEIRRVRRWPNAGLALAWAGILLAGWLHLNRGLLAPEASYRRTDERVEVLRMAGSVHEQLLRTCLKERHWSDALAALKPLDGMSADRSLRFAVILGELTGPKRAAERLRKLDGDLQARRVRATAGQAEARRILGVLYGDPQPRRDEDLPAAADGLPEEARWTLVRELGWFGRLALVPGAHGNPEALYRVGPPFPSANGMILAWAGFLHILRIAGLALLLLAVPVLALRGTFRSGLAEPFGEHGVLAEATAILLLIREADGPLSSLLPPGRVPWVIAQDAFDVLGMAAALGWLWCRGPGLSALLPAAGGTRGGGLLREAAVGALACLACRAATYYLGLFLPAGGHHGSQTTVDLWCGDPALRIHALLGLLVLAPLGEEFVYRGLLYRHLREATRGPSAIRSVLCATAFTAVFFSGGHGGGLSAIPDRLIFAATVALLREWRGSLVPSLSMHFLNNALWTISSVATGP